MMTKAAGLVESHNLRAMQESFRFGPKNQAWTDVSEPWMVILTDLGLKLKPRWRVGRCVVSSRNLRRDKAKS